MQRSQSISKMLKVFSNLTKRFERQNVSGVNAETATAIIIATALSISTHLLFKSLYALTPFNQTSIYIP